ncbi:MAG: thiamine diphosphokinase [Ignavibacteria bacterium]|nr:thiamine diphosphokinase [Ignavibacteria bacterium]
MKKCIILANGQPPQKSLFSYLDKVGYSTLICADGGANTAFKYKLLPQVIIGDLDSISKTALDYYKAKSKVIKITRQNDTDVEKCLKYAIKKKFNEVVLVGATGDRLDHSFCNLGIVLKFSDKIKISVIHQKSVLQSYSGNVTLKTIPGEVISLYGISRSTKIYSSGLKYQLKNISLPFGERESTSNIALHEGVDLKIKNGKIFVVRDYELMKKNGFI